MANVLTKSFTIKNIFKVKHFSNLTVHPSASIFINALNTEKVLFKSKSEHHINLALIYLPKYSYCDLKYYTTDRKKNDGTEKILEEVKVKLSLFQKFKIMYRDYWYVLVPVHIVTSAAWLGGFYFMAKSGIDIASLLESWHVSDRVVQPFRDSSMGYYAIVYALYKVATPARYTVTLGGTTISINYLKKWGYIKPVPSKERIKEIYEEKKDNIIETVRETKDGIIEKKDTIMESIDETKKGLKEKKDHIVESVKERKKILKNHKEIKNK